MMTAVTRATPFWHFIICSCILHPIFMRRMSQIAGSEIWDTSWVPVSFIPDLLSLCSVIVCVCVWLTLTCFFLLHWIRYGLGFMAFWDNKWCVVQPLIGREWSRDLNSELWLAVRWYAFSSVNHELPWLDTWLNEDYYIWALCTCHLIMKLGLTKTQLISET